MAEDMDVIGKLRLAAAFVFLPALFFLLAELPRDLIDLDGFWDVVAFYAAIGLVAGIIAGSGVAILVLPSAWILAGLIFSEINEPSRPPEAPIIVVLLYLSLFITPGIVAGVITSQVIAGVLDRPRPEIRRLAARRTRFPKDEES